MGVILLNHLKGNGLGTALNIVLQALYLLLILIFLSPDISKLVVGFLFLMIVKSTAIIMLPIAVVPFSCVGYALLKMSEATSKYAYAYIGALLGVTAFIINFIYYRNDDTLYIGAPFPEVTVLDLVTFRTFLPLSRITDQLISVIIIGIIYGMVFYWLRTHKER